MVLTKTAVSAAEETLTTINTLLYCSLVFVCVAQFPLPFLSVFISPLVFCLVLLNATSAVWRLRANGALFVLVAIGLLYLTVLFAASLVANNPDYSFRFYFILVALILVFFVRVKWELCLAFFVRLHLLKAVLFIGANVAFLVLGIHDHSVIRPWSVSLGGDIYTYDGQLFFFQVPGNALLPVALFLELTYRNKVSVGASILFLAVVIAGNFAFLIATALFSVVWVYRRLVRSRKFVYEQKFLLISLLLVILGLGGLVGADFVSYRLAQKSEVSLPAREEQTQVLMEDLFSDPPKALFGTGLGHTVSLKGGQRDYSNAIYYELQTLYILNQIGLVGFLVFFAVHGTLCVLFIPRRFQLVYISYLVFAVTNPYIFDTTQFVVLVLLISMKSASRRPSDLAVY